MGKIKILADQEARKVAAEIAARDPNIIGELIEEISGKSPEIKKSLQEVEMGFYLEKGTIKKDGEK